MADTKAGDSVIWNSPGGRTHGKVTQKITHDTTIGGHSVKASKTDPQYEVKSDKSGKKAIHKPESLTDN